MAWIEIAVTVSAPMSQTCVRRLYLAKFTQCLVQKDVFHFFSFSPVTVVLGRTASGINLLSSDQVLSSVLLFASAT